MKSIVKLACLNIRSQKFKYVIVFILIFIAGIGVYASEVLNQSLKNGLYIVKDRIGADVIVVPEGFVSETEDALFKGKACTIKFDTEWKDVIVNEDDVEKVCSQLYIASLNGASCCDGEIQLIAIDLENDFVIGPWIKENNISSLSDDEVIVGASFKVKKGDYLTYYNKKFKVVSILDETGGGYDKSVFISYDAAKIMSEDKRNKITFPFHIDDNDSSMEFVKLKNGVDPEKFKLAFEKKYANQEISVYNESSKMEEFADRVLEFNVFGKIMNVWILLISGISLLAVNTITTYNRKNEIGSMLTVGIEKRKIIAVFFCEYVMVMVLATLSSTILMGGFVYFFKEWIKGILNLPFVLVNGYTIFKIIIEMGIVNLLVLLCSFTISFYWIYKRNPADMIKEVGR